MKLTVLGVWGGYPHAGGACPGYLLHGEGYKVLIDCGSGVVSHLNSILSFTELDAIICSHLHLDHISDLYVLRYGYFVKQKAMSLPALKIYAPQDRKAEHELLNYKGAFDLLPLNKKTAINIGMAKFSFLNTKHGPETYSIKIEEGDKSFVYSADTGYDKGLVAFAENADLFLCESTFLEKYKKDNVVHCSAADAGRIATEAKVKKLLLTHFWYELQPIEYLRECQAHYPKLNVDTAKEMHTYCI